MHMEKEMVTDRESPSGDRERWERTDHLTSVRDSFLGHICSKVSVLIFHCARILDLMDRWTEDFTLTCPETSDEGWNLPGLGHAVSKSAGAPCVWIAPAHFLNISRSGSGD